MGLVVNRRYRPTQPHLRYARHPDWKHIGRCIRIEHIDGQRVPPEAPLAGLRIGVAEQFFFDDTSPGIAERVTEAAAAIEAAGATLSQLDLPGCAEVFELYFNGDILAARLYQC